MTTATFKSNRSLWIIVGVVGCLALCLFSAVVATGAYFLFGANPSTLVNDVSTTPTARPTKGLIDIPKDKATCEAQGGKWGRIGPSPRESCNLPTSDAGKVCSDSSECEGGCVANLSRADQDRITRDKAVIETQGKCTPWRIVVGCMALVTDGKVRGILCVD